MQSKATHLKALPEAAPSLRRLQDAHREMVFAIKGFLEAEHEAIPDGYRPSATSGVLCYVFNNAIERYRKPALSVVEGKDEVRVLGNDGGAA